MLGACVMNMLQKIAPWVLRALLFGAIPYSIYVRDYLFVFGAVAALITSLLPAYWERNVHAKLPLGLDLLATLALCMHIVLGEVFRFYDTHWYFDKIMHFYGTGIIAMLAFLIVFTLHWTRKVRLTLPFIAYFTVIFSMAVGSFWEIGEFMIDQIYDRNTQYSLENTMWDMIFNFFGGMTAAVLGVLYTSHKEERGLRDLTRPLRRILHLRDVRSGGAEDE